jgi:hypothetical protein
VRLIANKIPVAIRPFWILSGLAATVLLCKFPTVAVPLLPGRNGLVQGSAGHFKFYHTTFIVGLGLIPVSPVPNTPTMNALRTYALRHNWRLIKRVERAPAAAEIYQHPANAEIDRRMQ